MTADDITKEQMEAYIAVQMSGVTNMWAVDTVVALSDGELDKDACLVIMKNYSEIKERHGL